MLPDGCCLALHQAPPPNHRLIPCLLLPPPLLRYNGVANRPVKTAFRQAGFRVTASEAKCNVVWGNCPTPEEFAKMHEVRAARHLILLVFAVSFMHRILPERVVDVNVRIS